MYFDNILFNNKEEITNNIFTTKKGFLYGNMFPNELDLFENYSIKDFHTTNQKEKLLLDIYTYDFAINDLSLYLDLHPEDNSLYQKFRDYTHKLRHLTTEFENNYGPLELYTSPYNNYMWSKEPWPFIGGDSLV